MTKRNQLIGPLLLAALVLLFSLPASARPNTVTKSATEDDATVTITVLDQAIVLPGPTGDKTSFCEVSIDIEGTDVAFSSGDTFRLRVLEDDTPGNDLIWEIGPVTITNTELTNQRVQRTYDCSENFAYDGAGANLEIFARVNVEKANCGTFCLQDNPATPVADVAEVTTDDSREEDDTSSAAKLTGLGLTTDLISIDQDWYEFTLTAPSDITFDVQHRPGAGRIEATLRNSNNTVIATGTNRSNSTRIEENALAAGTYRVRVDPQDTADPNFYDVNFSVTQAMTVCTPGDTESRSCGDCGTETRTCNNSGDWDAYGACMNEGVCSPGDTETETCTGGERSRTCSATCQWGDFGACMGDACTGSETTACYTGPDGTEGVGACSGGMQTCNNGMFGACMGQTLPSAEVCNDNIDNDCDGATDAADTDCDGGGGGEALGEACEDASECSTTDCLTSGRFFDGYCSERDCTVDAECGGGDGVCVAADEDVCLVMCNSGADCRTGYKCTTLSTGDRVCYPACTDDSDCPFAGTDSCDANTDTCVAPTSGNNNTGNNANNTNNDTGNNANNVNNTNNGTNNGAPDIEDPPANDFVSDEGCGCAAGDGPPADGALVLVLLGFVAMASRRARRRSH